MIGVSSLKGILAEVVLTCVLVKAYLNYSKET